MLGRSSPFWPPRLELLEAMIDTRKLSCRLGRYGEAAIKRVGCWELFASAWKADTDQPRILGPVGASLARTLLLTATVCVQSPGCAVRLVCCVTVCASVNVAG